MKTLKSKTENWAKEFDRRFPSIEVGEFMDKKLWADKEGKHYINVECYQDWPDFYHYAEDGQPITPDRIKSFIRTLLQQARQEGMEEAIKLLDKGTRKDYEE
jgi:hypothetical protein